MKCFFTAASVVAALVAAGLWFRASTLEVRPPIEPAGLEAEAWANEARGVIARSSRLNAWAAAATAVSVILQAVSQIS